MKSKYLTIKRVVPGSIALESGVEAGDILLSVNGKSIGDVFDYRFETVNEELNFLVQKKNGELLEIEVKKDEYEDLGLEFEFPLMDEVRRCRNKCIFCFMDQLPANMRSTLYFKDDDIRLSFLEGNYVTLTNTGTEELKRIIGYRMSPVNVSVHTTNPRLRTFMMGNRHAGDIMEKIRLLVDGGIKVNCQIVLCRGINDGPQLDRTLEDLSGLYPGVNSISVVPVGLTRHREGLYGLVPFDRASSAEVLAQVEGWQERLLAGCGSRVVFPADEFYITAGLPIPPFDRYEDFPQLENGVGLVAMFLKEFRDCLGESGSKLKEAFERGRKALPEAKPLREVSLVTGAAAWGCVNQAARELERIFPVKVNAYKIENRFFGENVTVTGLLTGRDICEQLKGKELGDELVIPHVLLKEGEDLFLDGCTVPDLEERLGVKVRVAVSSAAGFIEGILGLGDPARDNGMA